jgi:hypothetical protein
LLALPKLDRSKGLENAARVIQKFFRRRLQFSRYRLKLRRLRIDRHLVFQRVLNIHPNDGTPEFMTLYYMLFVYFSKKRKSLNWVLKSLDNSKRSFETFTEVNIKAELDLDFKLTGATVKELREFIEQRRQFLYIQNNTSIEFRDKDTRPIYHIEESLDISHMDLISEEGGDRDKRSIRFIESEHYTRCIKRIQGKIRGFLSWRKKNDLCNRQLVKLFKCIWRLDTAKYAEIRCFSKVVPATKEHLVLVTGIYFADHTFKLKPLSFPISLCKHYGRGITKKNITEMVSR